MEILAEWMEQCLKKGLTFAAFQVAAEQGPQLWVQADQNETGKQGFVFAPFSLNGPRKTVWIRPDWQLSAQQPSPDFETWLKAQPSQVFSSSPTPPPITQDQHESLVQHSVDQIRAGKLDKVIISRPKMVPRPPGLRLSELFMALCDAYPKAHVSLVQHPQAGIWLGASPEILLRGEGQAYETVSLAGTRRLHRGQLSSPWRPKELREQEIVSEYLHQHLRAQGADQLHQQGPETVQAGQMAHLSTRFDFSYWGNPLELAQVLHPTPAVSGFPKQTAIDFIQAEEDYDRAYYAGFMGPVQVAGKTHLWVNLRNMQVLPDQLAIYVGGGITAASDPREEWEETELKSSTLLSVLEQLPMFDLKSTS